MKNRFLVCQVVVAVLVLFLTSECKKEEPAKLAIVSTSPVIYFTTTTARSGGNILSSGGAEISANGVCWSTIVNPVITDSKSVEAVGVTQFASSLSGLTAGTTYHVRAYATNSGGTAYGEDKTFTTLSSNSVSDAEGNIYNITGIGGQVWMSENLKTTIYNDGTSIPLVTDDAAWQALSTPGYCWYNNDATNTAYGALYNWYSVDATSNGDKNVCPTGWHVPSDLEWATLTTYLGGDSVAGGKLKEAGITHWETPNTDANNETGFTALPGGLRIYYASPSFSSIGVGGYWWSSSQSIPTDAFYRFVTYNGKNVYSDDRGKREGHSIRCLRD
jgi:uncharacterized protein (TIGR02145 family)